MDAQPTTPAQLTTEGSLRNTTPGDTGLLSEEDATVLAIGAAIGAAITLIVVAIIATAIKQCPATQNQGNADAAGDPEADTDTNSKIVQETVAQTQAFLDAVLPRSPVDEGRRESLRDNSNLDKLSSPSTDDLESQIAALAKVFETRIQFRAKHAEQQANSPAAVKPGEQPSSLQIELPRMYLLPITVSNFLDTLAESSDSDDEISIALKAVAAGSLAGGTAQAPADRAREDGLDIPRTLVTNESDPSTPAWTPRTPPSSPNTVE